MFIGTFRGGGYSGGYGSDNDRGYGGVYGGGYGDENYRGYGGGYGRYRG